MVVVPEFLMKRVYKKGSLKRIENGASFELKNVLGPGFISGLNYVKINDVTYVTKDVTFIMKGQEFSAESVTEEKPIAFRLGEEGTLIMTGQDSIVDGVNKIVIDVNNPEAGTVQVKVEDIV